MPEDPNSAYSFLPSGDLLDGLCDNEEERKTFINRFKAKKEAEFRTEELDEEEDNDNEEEEEEQHYPCPYCDMEFDIASLCSHLDVEHSSGTPFTVSTICNTRVSRDMLSHITRQHEHLFKLHNPSRSRETEIPRSQAQSLLREAYLHMRLARNGQRSSTATTDPLLSSFLGYAAPGAEDISRVVTSYAEDLPTKSVPSQHIWKTSFDPSLSIEERERRLRQVAGKAAFMQDLLYSTMLSD